MKDNKVYQFENKTGLAGLCTSCAMGILKLIESHFKEVKGVHSEKSRENTRGIYNQARVQIKCKRKIKIEVFKVTI